MGTNPKAHTRPQGLAMADGWVVPIWGSGIPGNLGHYSRIEMGMAEHRNLQQAGWIREEEVSLKLTLHNWQWQRNHIGSMHA